MIDSRLIASGDITHAVKLPLTIGNHEEEITAFVTTFGHYTLVLEIPWMRNHNIDIDFAGNTIELKLKFCYEHCLTVSTKVTSLLPTQDSKTIQVLSVTA